MFYKGEIEEDLRDDKYPSRSEWLMFREGDLNTFMKEIVEEQSAGLYDHHQSKDCPARGTCTPIIVFVIHHLHQFFSSCQYIELALCFEVSSVNTIYFTLTCDSSGCGSCWTVDGNWKLTFPHCMYPVANTVPNFRSLSFPAICPEELLGNKAFCANHCTVAEEHGYPTDIRSFVKFQKEAGNMYTAHSLLS